VCVCASECVCVGVSPEACRAYEDADAGCESVRYAKVYSFDTSCINVMSFFLNIFFFVSRYRRGAGMQLVDVRRLGQGGGGGAHTHTHTDEEEEDFLRQT
jgi:hypothetical protein